MDKNDFSTIKLQRRTLNLLKDMKGDGDTYDDVVMQLIMGGVTDIMDVEKVDRPRIAFSLEYYSYDVDESESYDVSFMELRESLVGSVIKIHHHQNSEFFFEQTATILFKDDVSAVVRIISEDKTENHHVKDADILNVVFY